MKKSFGKTPLIFPTPTWCIGVYDDEGKPNVMTIAWGGICCSDPVCMAVCTRSATYTHAFMMKNKAFTISVADTRHAKEADYFGMVSGRNHDKFAKTGLTAEKGKFVNAPYVAEFPMIIECTLKQTVELGLHTEFVGEVQDVRVDEEYLDEKGGLNMAKLSPLLYAPEESMYYKVGEPVGSAFTLGKEFLK